MRLNPDCIRDILLYVEKNTDYENHASLLDKEDFKKFSNYSYNEIMYHIKQCDSSGFFLGKVKYWYDGFIIDDLSPAGHEFLANIRRDTNWEKTKELSKKVGSSSLEVIKDISAQVISNLISNQFNK